MRHKQVVVIGGGLAGCEAAWQLASRGVEVLLYEMRPTRKTEAHSTSDLAELVCSNSLGSLSDNSASRILKDELTRLDAFVLKKAFETAVPAGASLAVDRVVFSQEITKALEAHPLIKIDRSEITEIPKEGVVIIATGPLTTKPLCEALIKLTGSQSLYFYDAISPIVSLESLDLEKMYYASRYGKGDPDFLNIPLDKEQYFSFVDQLMQAEVVMAHDFEEEKYFESCLPIETIASRGKLTLAFGPMKPVGLEDPKTGRRPFAVIQLRTENKFRTAYNLVGFQTKMKYGEQQRLFRQLPGMEEAEFLRLGSMHRNTYVDSPRVLQPTLQLRTDSRIFIAGQLTGTEGYLESSATGWLAGFNASRVVLGEAPVTLPAETMLGGLVATITDPLRTPFQPMNANMGILPPNEPTPKKRDKAARNLAFSTRSQSTLGKWMESGVAAH